MRTEHAVYIFRYEPCQVGNIRRMKAIMPNIIPKNITIDNADKYKEVLLEPSTIFRYNKLDPLMEWQSFVFKPTQESENLMS